MNLKSICSYFLRVSLFSETPSFLTLYNCCLVAELCLTLLGPHGL